MLIPDARAFVLADSFEEYQRMIQPLVVIEPTLPEELSTEFTKLNDLLEVCYYKYDLFELAQLYAVMLFEKALRIRLTEEYKNISKIKLSVLLDRAKQLHLLSEEQITHLRTLKDFRNKAVHYSGDLVDAPLILSNIKELMRASRLLFETE